MRPFISLRNFAKWLRNGLCFLVTYGIVLMFYQQDVSVILVTLFTWLQSYWGSIFLYQGMDPQPSGWSFSWNGARAGITTIWDPLGSGIYIGHLRWSSRLVSWLWILVGDTISSLIFVFTINHVTVVLVDISTSEGIWTYMEWPLLDRGVYFVYRNILDTPDYALHQF